MIVSCSFNTLLLLRTPWINYLFSKHLIEIYQCRNGGAYYILLYHSQRVLVTLDREHLSREDTALSFTWRGVLTVKLEMSFPFECAHI